MDAASCGSYSRTALQSDIAFGSSDRSAPGSALPKCVPVILALFLARPIFWWQGIGHCGFGRDELSRLPSRERPAHGSTQITSGVERDLPDSKHCPKKERLLSVWSGVFLDLLSWLVRPQIGAGVAFLILEWLCPQEPLWRVLAKGTIN